MASNTIRKIFESAFTSILELALSTVNKSIGEAVGSSLSETLGKTLETAVASNLEKLKQTDMPNGVMHKFKYTREEVYRVIAFLNKETGEMLQKLAVALGVPEDEALGRLLVIGKFIVEKGLYGDPSASGMYLCVVNQATGEVLRIMMPCGQKPDVLPDPNIRLVN